MNEMNEANFLFKNELKSIYMVFILTAGGLAGV